MLVNLLLVGFNSTYLNFRDIYWHYVPRLVQQYDPIKGVEPYPETQAYLQEIERLEYQVAHEGLVSDSVRETLSSLRQTGLDLTTENAFLVGNKVAQFAKVKRQLRRYTGKSSTDAAIREFWSIEFQQAFGWAQTSTWINQTLKPLLATNYYRLADENGLIIDRFWYIDIYFVLFLGLEFLTKSLLISRRTPGINWFDAITRRWYMLLFLLPTWRWLRLIPTVIQVHQSRLVDLERSLSQATYEPAAYLSDRVSKFILVRLINQTQETIDSGGLINALTQPSTATAAAPTPVEELSDRLLQVVIYRALPAIQPELEQLLRHSLRASLQDADWYQNLPNFPGLSSLPGEAIENLADYLAQASCEVLTNAYDDQEGRRLFDQLSQEFRRAIAQDLQDDAVRDRIQGLLVQMLEDAKANYLAQAEQDNPKATLAEAERLSEEVEAAAAPSKSDDPTETPSAKIEITNP